MIPYEGRQMLMNNGTLNATIPVLVYNLAAYDILAGLRAENNFYSIQDIIRKKTGLDDVIVINVLDSLIMSNDVEVSKNGFSITDEGKKLLGYLKDFKMEYLQ